MAMTYDAFLDQMKKDLEAGFAEDLPAQYSQVKIGIRDVEKLQGESYRGISFRVGDVIFEQPRTDLPCEEAPCTEKPYTAVPDTEEPCTENPAGINKDITSTEETNTEMNKERENKRPVRHKYGQYRNVLLSDEEMEKLMKEYPNDYKKRIERLSEYMASTGRIYKNHLATIRSWAKRDEEKARPAKQYDHGNYQFAAGESL